MALPARLRDCKEFSNSFNSNRVECILFDFAASGLTPDLCLTQNTRNRPGRRPSISGGDITHLRQNKPASGRRKELADFANLSNNRSRQIWKTKIK